MDEKYSNTREKFVAAIRTLAASPDSIQTRLREAHDGELKIKFARILDFLAVDQDDIETQGGDTVAHMTDVEAVKVADLICDFFVRTQRSP